MAPSLTSNYILEDAARDTGMNLRARDCPFCNEWADKLGARSVTSTRDGQDVVVSNVRFKRHVATHQEQLDIFALPRLIEEDKTLHKEVILKSNSDSESIRDSTDDEHGQYSQHCEEPCTSQLQETGTGGPPVAEPTGFETELKKFLGRWGSERIYDGDPDSDGRDIESASPNVSPNL